MLANFNKNKQNQELKLSFTYFLSFTNVAQTITVYSVYHAFLFVLYFRGGFSNNLRETLTYGELLKHELPNSKKLWISMQRALLYRHFMKLLE